MQMILWWYSWILKGALLGMCGKQEKVIMRTWWESILWFHGSWFWSKIIWKCEQHCIVSLLGVTIVWPLPGNHPNKQSLTIFLRKKTKNNKLPKKVLIQSNSFTVSQTVSQSQSYIVLFKMTEVSLSTYIHRMHLVISLE